ncbi:hypothetical protein EI94DRAFT_1800645 [Lactarius quietus]|nr:hypothetical protein EI94DRAFT_1800645 [Lactarius quietus]
MSVNWISIDAVRIVEVGESSDLATIWIGVELGRLTLRRAASSPMDVAHTSTVGLVTHSPPPSASRSPLRIDPGLREREVSTSAPAATTRTSTSPPPGTLSSPRQGRQQGIRAEERRKTCEEVMILGTSGFSEKLAAIDYEIRGQQFAIIEAEERVETVKGKEDPRR